MTVFNLTHKLSATIYCLAIYSLTAGKQAFSTLLKIRLPRSMRGNKSEHFTPLT